MAIEGPLKELAIPDVFQLLQLARKTGVLSVRSERQNDEALVHFERGSIVFALRRGSPRRLGQQLLRAGQLTERELERALEIQRAAPDRRLAQILLEMGSVDAAELGRQLRFQCEEALYDLMAWTEGNFRFEEREPSITSDIDVRVEVESLLMEGARRTDEWSQLEFSIPGPDSIPSLAPPEEDAPVIDLEPSDWEVLAEIDGQRDLRQVSADLGRSSFAVAKTVFKLINVGLVAVHERPKRLSPSEFEEGLRAVVRAIEESDFETAGRLTAEIQETFSEHAELTMLQGRVLAGQGRSRAATEAYARTAGLDPLSAEAHFRLGFSAIRIGEFERATRAWEAFLRLSPDGNQRALVSEALAAVETIHNLLGRVDA